MYDEIVGIESVRLFSLLHVKFFETRVVRISSKSWHLGTMHLELNIPRNCRFERDNTCQSLVSPRLVVLMLFLKAVVKP